MRSGGLGGRAGRGRRRAGGGAPPCAGVGPPRGFQHIEHVRTVQSLRIFEFAFVWNARTVSISYLTVDELLRTLL